MPSVTRRGFIKSTSLSMAAFGVLAGALPSLANAATDASQSQPQPGPAPVPVMPMTGGAPFMVYVSDPSSGAGTIMVGERAIPFTNGAIVQSIRQAIG
jgi:anaerobic selenocysteine-containing dehydrogenase